MKLLIITNHSYMLYRFRKELIQQLAKTNEVVLSMPFVGHEQEFMNMGIRCIDTPIGRREIRPSNELRLLGSYFRLLWREKPDQVITYSIKPNIYAGLCCRLLRIPYYANVQGLGTALHIPKLESAVSMMYKLALGKVEAVFFENQSNAELFRSRNIIPARKQVLLPGAGINLEEYTPTSYPENPEFHFLYVGRIMMEKGVNELLAAAKLLFEQYGSRFRLDIVGFFDDEDFSAPIRELEELGVAVFHGFQSDPKPFYSAADCVVVPSYHEGMSNVLLEASAMARPLITTDIPGCREAVDPGENGLLCQPKDTQSLYGCMERMLLMSPAERQAMGLAGRRKMELEFDRETVVARVLQTLHRTQGANP